MYTPALLAQHFRMRYFCLKLVTYDYSLHHVEFRFVINHFIGG